jgi:stearoyl-CoA desaturase (delta-9 desaturase)
MSSQNNTKSPGGHFITSVLRWFDSEANIESIQLTDQKKVDWLRIVPLLFLHLMCLGVFWVGWSWTAIGVALLLYSIRMFAITGFYHRYFSHKAFKTNRFWQFIFGAMGNASVQRGPLSQSPWILVEPYRLVNLKGQFSHPL